MTRGSTRAFERHFQTGITLALFGLLSWLVWTGHDNGKLLSAQQASLSYQAKQMDKFSDELVLVRSEISELNRDLNYATDVRTDVDRLGKSLEVIQQRLINLERNGQ